MDKRHDGGRSAGEYGRYDPGSFPALSKLSQPVQSSNHYRVRFAGSLRGHDDGVQFDWGEGGLSFRRQKRGGFACRGLGCQRLPVGRVHHPVDSRLDEKMPLIEVIFRHITERAKGASLSRPFLKNQKKDIFLDFCVLFIIMKSLLSDFSI